MYENMLVIEDVNSVLAHHIHFNEIYTLNTGLLPQSAFKEKYYDFCIIEMQEVEGYYQYKLEVYNRMWDGGISFKRIPEGAEAPLVQTDTDTVNYNGEYYIVYITVPYTDFDILLTLNNDNDEPRKIFVSEFSYGESLADETYYYYETKQKTIHLDGVNGDPVPNVDIAIRVNGESYVTGETDVNGDYTFNLPQFAPGDYIVEVSASRVGYDALKTYFTCHILKETPVLSYTPEVAYKGGFSSDLVKVTLQGNADLKLYLRCKCQDNKYGSDTTLLLNLADGVYSVSYEENLRKFRGDYIVINWSVEETEYTEAVNYTYVKDVVPKVIDNWADLKSECENSKGVDYVEFPVGADIEAGSTIILDRDMELYGRLSDTSWSSLNSSNNPYLFKTSSTNLEFFVRNVLFENNSNGVIYADKYSDVILENCYFKHNIKPDNLGTCVYNPVDSTYQNSLLCYLTVRDCIFENNRGSCIQTSGETSIDDSIFIVNDWDYAQHPQTYAVEVYAQATEVHGSTFIMDMGTVESPLPVYQHSNFSWGKIPFYIQREALFNGKRGSMMLKDNSLPYDDNTGYIYAKYLYDGVKTVASPVRGYEKVAFGHAISGKNWAWKDNIRTERESVYNNVREKPVYTPPAGSNRK